MKRTRLLSSRVSALALLSALLLSQLGCSFGDGPSANTYQPAPAPKAAAPPAAPRSIDELDRERANLKERIDGLKKFEIEQRQIGVIKQLEHEKSRGWVKLDGHPTAEEESDLGYAQAAAAEKEIQQLERQLGKIEKEKQQILSQSTGCFPAEMRVKMGDGSFKPIREVVPGDRVLTYDIGCEALVSRPVIKRYQVEANHLYTINGELATTGGERLLTQTGWKIVRDLKEGDLVHVEGRRLTVERIDYQRVERTLYNLQVADTHNFYVVTAEGVPYLVHNSGGGGGGK